MKKETTMQVYESPAVCEIVVTTKGASCASSAMLTDFEREEDVWEW